ncbi:MAG: cupredoxin domain-containing protein [Actinomycetota bacterium]
MRPVVSRPSPRSLALALIVLAAACGSIPPSEVEAPQGRQFIPMVPDSIDDVGLAPSVAVDAEGLPTISYFGFPAQLEEGEIPIARPVGSPFLTTEDGDDAGAVLLVSLTPEQIWNRGAIAQPRDTPSGVPVPFEPAAEPSLASLTKARAAGTDVAIAGSDVHTVWTTDKGVWYGIGPSPFEIGAVEATPEAGAPSVVVDGAGAPIVAYTIAGLQPEVRVAERVGENWQTTTAATLSRCGAGCPPATQLALVGGEPLVVTADPLSGEVIAARRQGGTWTTEVVATDATGGASVSTSGERAAIAYYTRTGVALATGRPGSWSVEEVASLANGGGDPTAVPTPPSTGVAVDRQGTVWVAWQDGDGIHLASHAEGTFEEVELPDTSSGVNPSLALTEDGSSVYLAWYDANEGDLRLGTYGEISGLKIAAPTPLPSPALPDQPGCGEDGEIVLDIVAQGIAFEPTCLVAPAGEPFTINFDNQDPVAETGQHNISIGQDSETVADDPIFKGELISGPDSVEYSVGALDEGSYFFRCDVHTNMTGTLVAASGGGGGGG